MKIIFVSILFGITVFASPLALIGSVSATTDTFNPTPEECQDSSLQSNSVCQTTPADTDPILGENGIIMKIANILAWFAGAIAVLIMIFAGFRIVKSSGDPAKIAQARETIIYALVGLVVIVLARFLVGFVISKL